MQDITEKKKIILVGSESTHPAQKEYETRLYSYLKHRKKYAY